MVTLRVPQKCLDNVRKRRPPIYCSEVEPGFCERVQHELNEFCDRVLDDPYTAIPMRRPNGEICYCCCGVGSRVAVDRDASRRLREVAVGDFVLATDPAASGWQRRRVEAVGNLGSTSEPGLVLRAHFRFAGGDERKTTLPAGQLLVSAEDGALVPLGKLKTGDRVRQADGEAATFLRAEAVQDTPVAHVSLGEYKTGDPLDVRMLNVDGLLTADLGVTIATYLDGEPPPS